MRTIKQTQAYYKDPNTGEYKSFNAIGGGGKFRELY